MKHKLFSIITLFVLCSLVILQGCVEPEDETPGCENSPPEYYKLTAAQKAILPYTGFDTISMVSNTGDTIHCIGTGKHYFNIKKFEPYGNPACAGYGTDKFYEAYKIEFVDKEKSNIMELAHYFLYPDPPNNYYGWVALSFKGNSFFIGDTQISRMNVSSYIGNVEIGGKVYHHVNKVQNDIDKSSFLIINKGEGIIKIQLNTTEAWELIKN